MADEGQKRERLESRARAVGAVPVGLIAAASALVGGLAVAWWHRKTLERIVNTPHPEPGHGGRDDEFGE